MKPLYPAVFEEAQAAELRWTDIPENVSFFRHILNVRQSFPSLILAPSAADGAVEVSAKIAESLLKCGINVFQPEYPAPVCALTQAMAARNMPLGLYLDRCPDGSKFALYAVSSHGGPIDEKDVLDSVAFPSNGNTGVLGTTELNKYYLNHLAGFADRHIEAGIGFAGLGIPFPGLEKQMRETPGLEILCQTDIHGLVAKVSNDGQRLDVMEKNGRITPVEEIASAVTRYLVKERLASGTIVGHSDLVSSFGTECEVLSVETDNRQDSIEMAHNAAFADMLTGWWPNGTIAHQGSSCFGDALLTAIYYLEALRSGI